MAKQYLVIVDGCFNVRDGMPYTVCAYLAPTYPCCEHPSMGDTGKQLPDDHEIDDPAPDWCPLDDAEEV